jgi:chromate transporter
MLKQNIIGIEPEDSTSSTQSIPFHEAFWVWVKVAIYSFGGPAGQIAVMHKILVEEKRWVSESRFLHALNYCMLLPGPEAQQLATYIGWLLHKTKGGLVAGTLFILPGFVSILLLSILYAGFQEVTLVQALFFGLKPAVMAVVVEAVVRIGRRVLKNEVMLGLAALSFIAIFFFNVPFPFIILTAGLIGYLGGRLWLEKFDIIQGHKSGKEGREDPDRGMTDVSAELIRPSLTRTLQILGLGLFLWFGPLLLVRLTFGPDTVFMDISLFFSKAAVVTFGGAYAVLAYMAQQAVEVYGWLRPGEMLDGLGLAETTPGPLIQVVQFVGFMGAYRQPGSLNSMLAGILGSILTTWVTFVPCFVWIFIGAPYIEYLRGNKALTTALSAITAAVVGVILNLAVWFSLHTIFGSVNEIYLGLIRLQIPVWSTLNLPALLIAIGAFVALFRYKQSMLTTLAGSATVGLIYYLLSQGG